MALILYNGFTTEVHFVVPTSDRVHFEDRTNTSVIGLITLLTETYNIH